MSKTSLIHTLNAELYYQLVQTSLQIVDAAGGWEAVVLTEQAETLKRFIDHPHAVPEPARPAPWSGIWPPP